VISITLFDGAFIREILDNKEEEIAAVTWRLIGDIKLA